MARAGYEGCLEAAGAVVLEFQQFGSYQGTWYAACLYNEQLVWAEGSFGSCSGCDSYQAEFGYSIDETPVEKMAAFGKGYLDSAYTHEQMLEYIARNPPPEWDSDHREAYEFIENFNVTIALTRRLGEIPKG